MNLYLMQHGEARSEQDDPARPLTERGRTEVSLVTRAVAGRKLGIAHVAHSGKLRARQTAEIVASLLSPTPALEEMPGIGPNDDPHVAAEAVKAASKPLLIVGHLPHLSRLASLLVVGDADKGVVAFRMAGLVCLAQAEGDWRLVWAVAPEILAD
jgi:phosphohistidine phosphatase